LQSITLPQLQVKIAIVIGGTKWAESHCEKYVQLSYAGIKTRSS